MNTLNETDLKNLKKLEAKLGKRLPEVSLDDILRTNLNCYSGDDKGHMTGLNLFDTQLADISFLRDFPWLTHLYLEYNKITDLSPLQPLINLTELKLRKNQITDLSPLSSLRMIA